MRNCNSTSLAPNSEDRRAKAVASWAELPPVIIVSGSNFWLKQAMHNTVHAHNDDLCEDPARGTRNGLINAGTISGRVGGSPLAGHAWF